MLTVPALRGQTEQGWVGLVWGDDWHLPYSTAFWWWSNSIYILKHTLRHTNTHTLGQCERERPQAQLFPTAKSATALICYSKHNMFILLTYSGCYLYLKGTQDWYHWLKSHQAMSFRLQLLCICKDICRLLQLTMCWMNKRGDRLTVPEGRREETKDANWMM